MLEAGRGGILKGASEKDIEEDFLVLIVSLGEETVEAILEVPVSEKRSNDIDSRRLFSEDFAPLTSESNTKLGLAPTVVLEGVEI